MAVYASVPLDLADDVAAVFNAGITGKTLALPCSPLNVYPPPLDVTPPVLTVVSPAGSAISAGQQFVVEVTDATGFALVVLTVELPAGGAHEVVWMSGNFASAYSASSTIAAIANGYRFSILRRGGWSASPTFHVEAIDTSGNVGA
jgi:hypothetical protein